MPRLKQILMPHESRVREAIDPLGTLPEVVLMQSVAPYRSVDNNLEITTYDIFHRSCFIGKADIRRDAGEGIFSFAWIDINRPADEPPKGKGLAAYLVAIETAHRHNKPWVNDERLSPDAKKIWDIFIEKGIAEVVTPFEEIQDPELNEPYFVGQACIPPLD